MPREEIRSARSTGPTGSEFFNALQEMSRDWMGRATAEVSEEMNARAEDARLLMSNGQKFMDATSRFLSSGWTNANMTT